MNNEPSWGPAAFVFRGCLNEADVVDIQRCHDRLLVRRWIRWLGLGVGTLVAALCVVSVVLVGPHVVTTVIPIAWACLLFVLPFERAWQARRHYRRHVATYLETQVILTNERLTIENDHYKAELSWNLVGLIADAPAGLLFLNTARQSLFWLPARLLQNSQSRERVLELAKANAVRVQSLP